MIRISTLTIFLLMLLGLPLMSQVDQVSIGASYTQQAYYKISTGEVTQVPNDAWDISFSSAGIQDGGVFINESASLTETPLKVFLSTETDWATAITDLSPFVDSMVLYNPEVSWTQGAFNSIRNPNMPFDYGWGNYNPMSNSVQGDKIFVIQKRDESYIKFQIQQLIGEDYTFRYADLDGSNEVSYTISKNLSEGVSLVYFSFETGDMVDMPTDYDLIFHRYTTPLADDDGVFIPYNVTGVLLAPNTEAAIADGVDPATVMESDYTDQYTDSLKVIGHDWKIFDFVSDWMIDENRAQFVRTSEGDVYKIVFFDYEGAMTGTTTLEKTLVGTSSTVDQSIEELGLSIYPNPSTDFITIEGQQDDIRVFIYDSSSSLIQTENITQSSQKINLQDYQSGMYYILIQGKDYITSQPLIITK